METILRNQNGNTVTKVIKIGSTYRLDVMYLGEKVQKVVSQKNYDSYYQAVSAYKSLTK